MLDNRYLMFDTGYLCGCQMMSGIQENASTYQLFHIPQLLFHPLHSIFGNSGNIHIVFNTYIIVYFFIIPPII